MYITTQVKSPHATSPRLYIWSPSQPTGSITPASPRDLPLPFSSFNRYSHLMDSLLPASVISLDFELKARQELREAWENCGCHLSTNEGTVPDALPM